MDERVDEAIELVLSPARAGLEAAPAAFDAAAHHALARKAAAEGCVLLKNEGDLLPLAPRTRVALIGDFAKTPRYQGAGSSAVNSTKVDSLLGLMGETNLELVGYEPGFERHGGESRAKLEAALDLAARAEVALLALGLDEVAETEGAERRTMALNANQVELLHAVARVNPRIVVLLSAGSCVESDWTADAPAVLYCALGGQAGAGGALDVVTGAVCPSGKLTETWPARLGDVPSSANYPAEGPACRVPRGHLRWVSLLPDGARAGGLSLWLRPLLHLLLLLRPQGHRARRQLHRHQHRNACGAEVAQLYAAKPDHKVFRPEQELRGFARVELAPGESRRVTIALDERAFSYFNVATGRWKVEGGTYEVRVGASSEDIRLVGEVRLAGTDAPNPYEGVDVAPYETADVTNVDDAHFAALLGRPVPDAIPQIGPNMCFRDLNHGRSAILWLVWLVLRSRVAPWRSAGSRTSTSCSSGTCSARHGHHDRRHHRHGRRGRRPARVRGWGWGGSRPSRPGTRPGWGPLAGCLLWLAWILAPILGALVANLVRNAALARKLAGRR